MINSDMDWHGDEAQRYLTTAMWDGLLAAAHLFWGKLQEVLNVPNPGEQVKRKRKTARGDKGSTYTIYPHPSAPNEPPRKRTGSLTSNIFEEYDEPNLTARIGLSVAAIYGLFLELGTKKMKARPWFNRTLEKMLPMMELLAGSGFDKEGSP